MHEKLPAIGLARKSIKNARESEPVNPQMYFFFLLFLERSRKKQEGLWKVDKNHYSSQITLTLPRQ